MESKTEKPIISPETIILINSEQLVLEEVTRRINLGELPPGKYTALHNGEQIPITIEFGPPQPVNWNKVIYPRKPVFKVGSETITEKEFKRRASNEELPFGTYKAYVDNDDVIVNLTPKKEPTTADQVILEKIISWFKAEIQGKQHPIPATEKDKFAEYVEGSVFLKYLLIDALLVHDTCKKSLMSRLFSRLPRETKINYLKFLISSGCQHYVMFHSPKLEVVKLMYDAIGAKLYDESGLDGHFSLIKYTRDPELIEFLFTNGLDYNRSDPKFGTVLHVALACEDPELSAILLTILSKPRFKFDLARQDSFGKTPLMIATLVNDEAAAKELLQLHAAGTNIGLNIADKQGRTPLMIALALGRVEIVRQLIQSGANLLAVDNRKRGVEEYLNLSSDETGAILREISIEPHRNSNAPSNWLMYSDGFPLYYSNSTDPQRRILLSLHPDHNQPLIEAVRIISSHQSAFPGLMELLETQLKDLGGSTTYLDSCLSNRLTCQNLLNEALLRRSAELGTLNQVVRLLEKNIDVNCVDSQDRTPLFLCLSRMEMMSIHLGKDTNLNNEMAVFRYLLNNGADATIKNSDQKSVVTILNEKMANPSSYPNFYKELAKLLSDQPMYRNKVTFLGNSLSKLLHLNDTTSETSVSELKDTSSNDNSLTSSLGTTT